MEVQWNLSKVDTLVTDHELHVREHACSFVIPVYEPQLFLYCGIAKSEVFTEN